MTRDPVTSTAPGSPPASGGPARDTLHAARRVVLPLTALATAVLVGLGLGLLQWASGMLTPILLGLFLAALASPIHGWARSRHWSSRLALVMTVTAVAGIVALLLVLLALSAWTLVSDLAGYQDDLRARYPELGDALASLDLDRRVAGVLDADRLSSLLGTVATGVAGLLTDVTIAVVLAALLLLDGERLARVFRTRIDSQAVVMSQLPQVLDAAITYFVVRIRVNLVTALGFGALLLVLGVDHALLWAVGVFFLSFVPYIGLAIAMIPPALLAFAESGLGTATLVVIGAVVLNVLAENVLEPALTGRALKLATWAVFVSFFFWVWVLGPIGALLSMPITVLIVLVLERDARTRWMAAMLGRDGPTPDPDAA